MNDSGSLNQQEMEHRFKLLHYKVQSQRLAQSWAKFEEAGYKPILIKGWAAAQLYPNPCDRQYTDIDLIFSPTDFGDAEEFLKENSMPTAIDLHKGARHLDSLSFDNLYSNSVLIDCEGTKIRILREEDHLRVLCIHWLNDGGADKERLWDIYHGINNRSEKFDWHRLLEKISKKRRRWIVCAIGLAHKYLDLNLDDTPIAAEAKNLPSWLTKAVEREWASSVRLTPLQQVRHDKQKLWQQIKKRLPPNPIQATIEMEGHFDMVPRLFYQFADIFLRLPGSIDKYRKSRPSFYRRKNFKIDG